MIDPYQGGRKVPRPPGPIMIEPAGTNHCVEPGL
jgi:hypothetical protein